MASSLHEPEPEERGCESSKSAHALLCPSRRRVPVGRRRKDRRRCRRHRLFQPVEIGLCLVVAEQNSSPVETSGLVGVRDHIGKCHGLEIRWIHRTALSEARICRITCHRPLETLPRLLHEPGAKQTITIVDLFARRLPGRLINLDLGSRGSGTAWLCRTAGGFVTGLRVRLRRDRRLCRRYGRARCRRRSRSGNRWCRNDGGFCWLRNLGRRLPLWCARDNLGWSRLASGLMP